MQTFIQVFIFATFIGHIGAADFGDQYSCPPGWTNATDGTDKSATYCFNCGLQDLPALGCPQDTGGNLTAYINGICKPFHGHFLGPIGGKCVDQASDPNIFPTSHMSTPIECHSWGDNKEVTAQGFSNSGTVSGMSSSNSCGFLVAICPNMHDQAMIYRMKPVGGKSFDNRVDKVANDTDFSSLAYSAVKITSNGKTCS